MFLFYSQLKFGQNHVMFGYRLLCHHFDVIVIQKNNMILLRWHLTGFMANYRTEEQRALNNDNASIDNDTNK